MESQTKSENSQPVKLALGAAVVVATVAALYLTVGGTSAGLLSKIKHPFDPVASQVEAEMGYSNPALVKQLKSDRDKLLKFGITTPTRFAVAPWGPKNQESDEFTVNEVEADGSSYPLDLHGVINVNTTLIKIKATLVGKDGCGDIKFIHKDGEAKLCLKQDEEFVIPVKKTDEQVKLEADDAKKAAEYAVRHKGLKRPEPRFFF